MELNREQVVKALVCCETGRAVSCENCPMRNIETADNVVCSEMLARYALSLINELTESEGYWKQQAYKGCMDKARMDGEINELTKEVEGLKQCLEHEHASFMETFGEWSDKCEKLTEENERLKKDNITLEQKLMLLGIDKVYVFKAQVKGE